MRELPPIDSSRIAETQALIEQAFRHETPERLPFFFAQCAEDQDPAASRFVDAHAVEQQMTGWSDWERPLTQSLDGIRWWHDQPYSPLFPPPRLIFDCPQETILTPFGVAYERLPDGRVTFDWTEPVIRSLPEGIARLRELRAGFLERGLIPEFFAKARFMLDETGRQFPLTLPDYQGPLSLASKLMPPSELLLAMLLEPEGVRELLDVLVDIILDFIQGLESIAGGPELVQANILLPRGCRGVVWDDFVSVVTPAVYRSVAVAANDRILGRLGRGELHTCGPCLGGIAEAIMAHRNALSFQVVFAAADKTRTTAQLLELKNQCRGRALLNIIGMPFDLENFTVDFVRRMNEDGGVMFLGCAGSDRQLREWHRVIERAGSRAGADARD